MSSIATGSDTHDVVVVHRQRSPHYGITADHIWYPTSPMQIRDLLGKLLTQLDAMGLPDRAHRAAKTLLVQEVWRWWDGVYENATTSESLAPVVGTPGGRYIEGQPSSNRWGWKSEDDWLADVALGPDRPSTVPAKDEVRVHIAGDPIRLQPPVAATSIA